jgi:hypothetical protein
MKTKTIKIVVIVATAIATMGKTFLQTTKKAEE